MLLSNQMLFPIIFNYREEQLKEDEDVAFLVRYMKDHYMMTQSDAISEIYNNY